MKHILNTETTVDWLKCVSCAWNRFLSDFVARLLVVEDKRGWAMVTFEEEYVHARSAVGVVVLCCCLLKV